MGNEDAIVLTRGSHCGSFKGVSGHINSRTKMVKLTEKGEVEVKAKPTGQRSPMIPITARTVELTLVTKTITKDSK